MIKKFHPSSRKKSIILIKTSNFKKSALSFVAILSLLESDEVFDGVFGVFVLAFETVKSFAKILLDGLPLLPLLFLATLPFAHPSAFLFLLKKSGGMELGVTGGKNPFSFEIGKFTNRALSL